MRRLDNHRDPDHVWSIMENAMGILAFDVGANIGQSTKTLAENFERVIAWEPCIESFEILSNEAPRCVICAFGAISDHDGEVALTETQQHIETGQLTTGEGLQWGPMIGERKVPCITLDHAAMDFGNPSFVKIDTEGHEIEVVRGGQLLLSTEFPKLLIEVHRKENEQILRDLLMGYNIEKLEHESLRPESEIRQNHFWLYCEG